MRKSGESQEGCRDEKDAGVLTVDSNGNRLPVGCKQYRTSAGFECEMFPHRLTAPPGPLWMDDAV